MFLVSVHSIQGDISSHADKWAKRSSSTWVCNRAVIFNGVMIVTFFEISHRGIVMAHVLRRFVASLRNSHSFTQKESTHVSTTTVAAWKSKPTFYAISKQAKTTAPELERFLADRMKAKTIEVDASHVSLISKPKEIAALILLAAGKTA